MTYSELCTAVADFVENSFTADQLATFFQQTEQRIYNSIQIPALRKTVTGALTANNQFLACPTDYLAAYSAAVISPTTGAYTFLLDKDVNYIREAYPIPTSTGTPKYYALFGTRSDAANELTFILGPTPDLAYVAELNYFYYPESIVTAGSTWLSDNFDPVLLYGALVEANTFLKGDAEMTKLYIAKYDEATAQLKRLCDGLERQDAYRSGQVRVKVT